MNYSLLNRFFLYLKINKMIIPATFGYHTAGCDQEIPSTDNEVRGQNNWTGKNSLVWNGKSRRI
tara:strand:- start:117 stop:308 length:192 start_codon:yes stop_codon:yes gene_type:complete